MKKYALNCWKSLKITKLQHKDEISLSVIVTKVEKISNMKMRLNPLFLQTMGNQQPSLEKRKVQRLSYNGVEIKQFRSGAQHINVEDIVCTLWKHKETYKKFSRFSEPNNYFSE